VITYINQIETILDGIEKLVESEFNIPVKESGNEYFKIDPISDDLIENLHGGQSRSYSVLVSYTMIKAGHFETNRNHLTNRAERMKRLLFNNTAYDDGGYVWHDGRVNGITYEQDEDNLEIYRALIEFSCNKQESI
jgi:hypothetical protein